MKENLAELEQWGADVIFGRAKGFRAGMTRIAMSFLSVLFRGVVHARMAVFRKQWKQQAHLGTQVISIGNITVGGTGKTPVTELLSKTLRDRGRSVAILSRGYKSRRLKKAQKWEDNDGKPIDSDEMPKIVSDGGGALARFEVCG